MFLNLGSISWLVITRPTWRKRVWKTIKKCENVTSRSENETLVKLIKLDLIFRDEFLNLQNWKKNFFTEFGNKKLIYLKKIRFFTILKQFSMFYNFVNCSELRFLSRFHGYPISIFIGFKFFLFSLTLLNIFNH